MRWGLGQASGSGGCRGSGPGGSLLWSRAAGPRSCGLSRAQPDEHTCLGPTPSEEEQKQKSPTEAAAHGLVGRVGQSTCSRLHGGAGACGGCAYCLRLLLPLLKIGGGTGAPE